jgi:hypothetical protein
VKDEMKIERGKKSQTYGGSGGTAKGLTRIRNRSIHLSGNSPITSLAIQWFNG